MKSIYLLLAIALTYVSSESAKDRYLSLPVLEKCNSRFKEFTHNGQNYFYSGHHPDLKDKRLDWLDSRNTCREYCMETISFEKQSEFDFFRNYIETNNISFIWTSGRLCDFEGCEGRWDLLPKRIKGWLWSANQERIADTDKKPDDWDYQPWSRTGHKKKPQPDNAEYYVAQVSESCLGILNNQYNDSVGWHDIACYHRARFICEDSPILLEEVKHLTTTEKTVEDETTTTSSTAKTSTARVPKDEQATKPTAPPTTTSTVIVATTTEAQNTESGEINGEIRTGKKVIRRRKLLKRVRRRKIE